MATTIIYTVTMGTTINYMALIFTSKLDASLSYKEHFGLLEESKNTRIRKNNQVRDSLKHYIARKMVDTTVNKD